MALGNMCDAERKEFGLQTLCMCFFFVAQTLGGTRGYLFPRRHGDGAVSILVVSPRHESYQISQDRGLSFSESSRVELLREKRQE